MYLANNFLTENFVFVLQEKRGKKYIYLQGHWKERGESYNQSHCPKNVLTRTLEGKGLIIQSITLSQQCAHKDTFIEGKG